MKFKLKLDVRYFKSLMYAIAHDGYDPYNSLPALNALIRSDALRIRSRV